LTGVKLAAAHYYAAFGFYPSMLLRGAFSTLEQQSFTVLVPGMAHKKKRQDREVLPLWRRSAGT